MLLKKTQIINNLRRTIDLGLISLLSQQQLEELSLKYYGVYREDKLVGYTCPYSGELITDFNDLVLEHIIPVASNGGTVLFNCIPTSSKVNSINEKGAKHLLKWWKKKEYYTPEKLDTLLSYIFEAYDMVFEENKIEEIDDLYDDIEFEQQDLNKNADLDTSTKEQFKKIKEQAKSNGIISYFGFINDCIDELKSKGFNTTKYQEKIKKHEENNILKDFDRYVLFQEAFKEIIAVKLEDNNSSILTYTLNTNISKLMQSMFETETKEQIYDSLLQRINNLENILEKNNIGILSLFEDIKNNEAIYIKETNLTESDIDKLIQEINLCVSDKFNKMIDFVISNNGVLPRQGSKEKTEKKLGEFRNRIQSVSKKGTFYASLTKEQLEYLHNSKYKELRDIYKVILNKSIENNIKIEYIDKEMKKKIDEFHQKNKNLTIEEQIVLEKEYKDVIVIDSQFNEMIDFVISNNGVLPSTKSKEETEKKLGSFRSRIQSVTKKGTFHASLTKEQLEYLHNSKYKELRDVYKVILNKSIENNIKIEYIDEEMKKKIDEFHQKNKNLTIEEQIVLEKEYKDVIVIDSQFNEMIDFVISNKGVLPRQGSKEETEKKLGGFRRNIQSVSKGTFATSLTKEQLEYLHNSKYKELRDIYKVILNKSIENNIKIEYIDEEMKKKIDEFHQKNKNLTIEEQIVLEKEYKDVIVIDSQFNEMIDFVISNNGVLPSTESKEETEKKLGGFRSSIQSVSKGTFATSLTKEQLEYLHNSKYKELRDIYKVILNKSIENNIKIEYIDKEMKKKIDEFHQKNKNLTIEEQIVLEKEYKDVIVIDSQFNEMIDFVISNNGVLPSTESKEETEKKLGGFRSKIQSVTKKGTFNASLRKEQLEYLHNSKYKELRDIYKVILNKSIENNIKIEYIDEEMKKKIDEFHQKNKNLTIEEQIVLEKEYKDVIVIDSQFNEMIDFVISNNGVLPRQGSKEETEKKLGEFRNRIQSVSKGTFATSLTKEQLEYLHNSKYKELRDIYKVILNKSIENNIKIEYIDKEMKKKIDEFHQKNKNLTIEEQIVLEKEYKDVIVIDSQFNEMIDFVISNNGVLPSTKSKEETEKKLGSFRSRIQSVTKKGTFATSLTKEQLEYLHNSKYKELRDIYKVILNKSIENNIKIEYIDEEMKKKIDEFHQKNKNLTIEEQIVLEKEYKDVIVIDSQFNEMIDFVISNNGVLPSTDSKKEETEKKLGRFRSNIQSVKKNGTFHASLTKEQLEYLHNSKYNSIRQLYENIIEKAYIVDYKVYIDIDKELRGETRKGRRV